MRITKIDQYISKDKKEPTTVYDITGEGMHILFTVLKKKEKEVEDMLDELVKEVNGFEFLILELEKKGFKESRCENTTEIS